MKSFLKPTTAKIVITIIIFIVFYFVYLFLTHVYIRGAGENFPAGHSVYQLIFYALAGPAFLSLRIVKNVVVFFVIAIFYHYFLSCIMVYLLKVLAGKSKHHG